MTVPPPEKMDVDALAEACREESARFFRAQGNDDRFCFELFRRALKLRNDYAWQAVWSQYRNLVIGWLRGSDGFENAGMPTEEMVTLSFERLWYATRASRPFDSFTSLQALLEYLRLCCVSTVTDRLRRTRQERALASPDDLLNLASPDMVEHEVMEDQAREQLWGAVSGLLNDDEERLLVQGYFVMGFKPRHIQERHPETFGTIADVYRVKRNVMNRLRRAETLRNLWGE